MADSLLESGAYYFEILVSDGKNQISAYKQVSIQGIAKRFISLIATSESNASSSYYELSESNQSNLIFTVNSDYKKAEINNMNQQLWHLSNSTNEVLVFDLKEKTLLGGIIGEPNFTIGRFTDIYYSSPLMFLSNNQGRLNGIDPGFSKRNNYVSSAGNFVNHLIANEDIVVVEETINGTSLNRIAVLFRASAAIKFSQDINYPVIDMFFKSDSKALLFCQNSTGISVFEYDVEQNFIQEIKLSLIHI